MFGPPSHVPPDDSDDNPPVFCLRYLVRKFGIGDCDKNQKAAFADTLRKLSQLKWRELRQSNYQKLGYEIIARPSILVGIPPVVTPEVNIISFRCFGVAPMIGFRDRSVLHIVWLDPKRRVYRH